MSASSLNFHDLAVVSGQDQDRGRPHSDVRRVGEVVDVGEGVSTFKNGDHVLSTFFPNWISGNPTRERLMGVPGDGADGFAAEYVAMPAETFTRLPKGWSLPRGGDLALRRADGMARADGGSADQAG